MWSLLYKVKATGEQLQALRRAGGSRIHCAAARRWKSWRWTVWRKPLILALPETHSEVGSTRAGTEERRPSSLALRNSDVVMNKTIAFVRQQTGFSPRHDSRGSQGYKLCWGSLRLGRYCFATCFLQAFQGQGSIVRCSRPLQKLSLAVSGGEMITCITEHFSVWSGVGGFVNGGETLKGSSRQQR